jgi:hypothetical protein
MSAPDTWSELAKIAVASQAGADIEFQAILETVDIDVGDKDFDVIATLAGGRLVKFTPEEPITITLEGYAVEAGTDTGTTAKGFFDLYGTADASQPVQVVTDRTRSKKRIAVMWTDSTVSAVGQVVAPTNYALRIVAADGYFTSVKPSMTDGVLKFTIVYKVPPFDKTGNPNFVIESVGGSATATLATLSSYTSTIKGVGIY